MIEELWKEARPYLLNEYRPETPHYAAIDEWYWEQYQRRDQLDLELVTISSERGYPDFDALAFGRKAFASPFAAIRTIAGPQHPDDKQDLIFPHERVGMQLIDLHYIQGMVSSILIANNLYTGLVNIIDCRGNFGAYLRDVARYQEQSIADVRLPGGMAKRIGDPQLRFAKSDTGNAFHFKWHYDHGAEKTEIKRWCYVTISTLEDLTTGYDLYSGRYFTKNKDRLYEPKIILPGIPGSLAAHVATNGFYNQGFGILHAFAKGKNWRKSYNDSDLTRPANLWEPIGAKSPWKLKYHSAAEAVTMLRDKINRRPPVNDFAGFRLALAA